MKESDLYGPVRDWLTSQGYQIHVEIFDADVIGVKDGRIVVVELKACLSYGVFLQCHKRASWADEVWAAIGSTPKDTGDMKRAGFGLLIVKDGKVRKRFAAKPQPWHWHRSKAYRAKKLACRAPAQPHELAGLPSNQQLTRQRMMRSASSSASSATSALNQSLLERK